MVCIAIHILSACGGVCRGVWVVCWGVGERVWGLCWGLCRVVLGPWERESIARSALLSGYLGKFGHLPRF